MLLGVMVHARTVHNVDVPVSTNVHMSTDVLLVK